MVYFWNAMQQVVVVVEYSLVCHYIDSSVFVVDSLKRKISIDKVLINECIYYH